MREFLEPGRYVDSDAESVRRRARGVGEPEPDARARSVRFYHAVRDGIVYTPYCDFRSLDTYRASACLERGSGFCVAKAALLAALARASGIPARVGFADVRNHLATPRLLALMGTDVFYFHGYAELFDSLFHEYDTAGRRHLEYLRDQGPYVDVPAEEIMETFSRHYPGYAAQSAVASATRFRREAERLARGRRADGAPGPAR
jgi:transglutaminase-like putative cysteine protease